MLTITGSLWLVTALGLIIVATLGLLVFSSYGERSTMTKYPQEQTQLSPNDFVKAFDPGNRKGGIIIQASANKSSLKKFPARRVVVDESRVDSIFTATEEEVKKLMCDPSLEETTEFCAPEGAFHDDDDDIPSNPMETAYNRYCDSDRYLENQHRSFTEGWKACIQYLFKGEK